MTRGPQQLLRSAALVVAGMSSTVPALAGSCSVTSTGLAFGRYQPLTFAGKLASIDRTADGAVSVACTSITGGGSYSISLGPSAQGNSTVPRYLAHDAGGPGMAFNVYLDAAYTSVWGDGFTGAVLSGSIPAGDSMRTHNVFGRVPAGQHQLRAGSYSSYLTMTITYNP